MEGSWVRAAVQAAGSALWNPEHLRDRELGAVVLDEVVALPVGSLAIGHAGEVIVSAPMVVQDDAVRRARAGDGVIASLLTVLASGGAGSLEAVHVTGPPASGDRERRIGVDQSNESYVIDEAVVVKLFPRATPGPHPAVDVPAHLAANGFTETPAALGALRWGRDVLLATASAFVPGARDGWEWYVELVERACADGSWGAADAPAPLIGALVARLHRALATPSSVLADPTGVAGAATIRAWHARAVATLDEALEGTPEDAGERLGRLAPRARAILDRLLAVEETPIQRVHGDLHVGQILRDAGGALWVSDFDGNPLAPPPTRTAKDAAARDVVAMACAIDHVGRVVTRRVPEAHDALADWIERSRAAFLTAYRMELGRGASLFDGRLLHPFAVAQEAHEYCYATSYLPRWRYVPDAAMPAAIARAEAES